MSILPEQQAMAEAVCMSGPPCAATPHARRLIPHDIARLAALWVIVALVVSVPSIGVSVINAHMASALHIDRAALGGGFGVFIMAMGIPAPLFALALRRFGVRRVMLVGCGLGVLGSLLMGTLVNSGLGFTLSFGLLVGLGVGASGVLPVQTVVATWFRERRALAVSVVLSAIDVAGFVAPAALERLINATGNWRTGWWAIAGLIVVAGLLVLRVVPADLATDPREIERHRVAEAPKPKPHVYITPAPWPPARAARTRQFTLILVYACVIGIDWIFFLVHGIEHLQDIGYSSGVAAAAVSVMVAASLAGNLSAGALGDHVPLHLLCTGALLIVTIGLAASISPMGIEGMVLFAIPVGFGYGASQVCWITLLSNYFGAPTFPVLYGMVLAPGTLTAAISAGAAGAVFDHAHSYEPVIFVYIVLSLLAAFATLFASPASLRARA
jgi:MFS family permease